MATPFVGELKLVPYNFEPVGWLLCNGQLLPIDQFTVLFQLIGTTYGGDGQTTFAVPDLRGRAAMGVSNASPLGLNVGQEAHTLTIAETPAHSHSAQANSSGGNQTGVGGAVWASDSAHLNPPYRNDAPNAAMNPGTILPAGNSQPHTNMQPYLVLRWMIAFEGVFPSQS